MVDAKFDGEEAHYEITKAEDPPPLPGQLTRGRHRGGGGGGGHPDSGWIAQGQKGTGGTTAAGLPRTPSRKPVGHIADYGAVSLTAPFDKSAP